MFPVSRPKCMMSFLSRCHSQHHHPHIYIFWQIHSSLQSHLTLNQQETSFLYWIPWRRSYQMGVWSLICLYSGGRDIKTLNKLCSNSIDNQIWMYIFDMRLQSQRKRANSWGVTLAWLRLDGILGCWIWFWLSRLRTDSIPALLQGHGFSGGRI